MVPNQYFGRSQRPKGYKIKTTLQVVLLFVVFIWLLYQIKHSHFNTDGFSLSLGNKLSQNPRATELGRKGNAGYKVIEVDIDDEGEGKGKGKEDGGDGDDELDRISQQESQANEGDDADAQVSDREGEAEGSENNEEDPQESKEDAQESAGDDIPNNEEKGDDKDQVKQQDKERDHTDIRIGDGTEALGLEKNTISPHAESETVTGIEDFHDENGIPPGSISESIAFNDTLGVNIDEETLPAAQKSADLSHDDGGHDPKSDESGEASNTESANNIPQTGLKVESSIELETSSLSSDMSYKPISNVTSAAVKEDSIVSEDLSSDHSPENATQALE